MLQTLEARYGIVRAQALTWFKTSHSSNDGPACVEVASAPGTVYVRDAKDKQGPKLAFTSDEWSAFAAFAAEFA